MKVTKPGYRGTLHVAQAVDGGHVVAWDVLTPDGWYIYDSKRMTFDEILDWTGVDLRKPIRGRR
jgi:hypothetical protein